MVNFMNIRNRITCGGAGTDYPGFTSIAIQSAIDAALEGDEILLSEGEYLLTDSVRLRDNISLRGYGIDKTILLKNVSVKCTTEGFCGYGHKEIMVTDGSLFHPGDGVYLTGDYARGFQATQTTVTDVEENIVFLADPLEADLQKHRDGSIETIFPLIKGINCRNAAVYDMTLEGNAQNNGCLGGCRGGGIFLIGCSDISVEHVKITNFNGEGFSYQQCRNISIEHSECSYNKGNGVHPGSGTVGMLINDCDLHHNEKAGIYYCLRICFNICRGNRIYDNGLEGITIGHRDDYIEIDSNEICRNGKEAIFFRPENYPGMSGRYVSVFRNKIYDNARTQGKAQIYNPADLTGFEMYDNNIEGQIPFLCDGELHECVIGKHPDNARRIDINQIPEKEYRHL